VLHENVMTETALSRVSRRQGTLDELFIGEQALLVVQGKMAHLELAHGDEDDTHQKHDRHDRYCCHKEEGRSPAVPRCATLMVLTVLYCARPHAFLLSCKAVSIAATATVDEAIARAGFEIVGKHLEGSATSAWIRGHQAVLFTNRVQWFDVSWFPWARCTFAIAGGLAQFSSGVVVLIALTTTINEGMAGSGGAVVEVVAE